MRCLTCLPGFGALVQQGEGEDHCAYHEVTAQLLVHPRTGERALLLVQVGGRAGAGAREGIKHATCSRA